jgi:hypothetical protein
MEQDAFVRDAVERRGVHEFRTVSRSMWIGLVVGDDEHNVGSLLLPVAAAQTYHCCHDGEHPKIATRFLGRSSQSTSPLPAKGSLVML